MKITSWNVNSVRARINNILDYIKRSKPDILMLQEIKTENKNFPTIDFKKEGYTSYIFGQKSYNGVAFLSKIKINNISTNFIKDKLKQSRIIEGNIKNKKDSIKLINVYVPNGNPVETEKYDYKKNWLNSFIKEVDKALKKNKNIIISGDFNVIPEEIDCHDHKKYENDALFKIEIRKKFRELLNLGFKLIATKGTALYLVNLGIQVEEVLKVHEGRPNIEDLIRSGLVQLIINTPIGSQALHDDAYLRRAALEYNIPTFTTIPGAKAAIKAIKALQCNEIKTYSLQEIHNC